MTRPTSSPSNPRLRPGRRTARVATVAGLLLSAVGLPGWAAATSGEGGCPVVASAQGVQVMVSASDNLLLQAPTGASVPHAQACVNFGLSDSSGFAGSPYPGETVLAAPALVRGAIDEAAPIPDYPAHATSRHPGSEDSEVEQPGLSLSSHSSGTSTEARAYTGVGQDGTDAGSALATASAEVDPDAKTATATAVSDTQPLTVNEVLELGRVRSIATAEIDADGKVRRTSKLLVGRTAVAGQVVQITPEGVEAAGQTAPLPEADPVKQLEAAGIEVRYLTEEKTERGVLSAGIEVTLRRTDPDTGAVTTVAYTLGRAFAAVAPVEARGGTPAVPGVPAIPPPAEGAPAVAEGQAPLESAPVAGDFSEAAPLPGKAPDVAPALVVAQPTRTAGKPVDMGVTGFYLVVVFAALTMVASGTLLRLLGVRTRWTA